MTTQTTSKTTLSWRKVGWMLIAGVVWLGLKSDQQQRPDVPND